MPPITSELRGVGDADIAAAARRVAAVPYDFRRPSKLSREHVRVLQIAYETLARRLTTLLTSNLRQVCQVTIADISQHNYEEYVQGLPTQTFLVPINLPQLGSAGVLEFSLEVAMASIDHMLGGPGGEQAPRALTDIETTLMRGLLDQVCGVFQYSMEQIFPLSPTVGPIEYNPQFLQAAAATDAVVVGNFDMAVGSEQCTMTLCLPLAPLLPKLMQHRQRSNDKNARFAAAEAARRLRDRLGGVPVDVSVEFNPVDLSSTRILTLTQGDVVMLPHRAGAPLSVQAGEIVFAQAVAGKSGNRLAALIVSTDKSNL